MLLTRPLGGELSGRKMVLRSAFKVFSEISEVTVLAISDDSYCNYCADNGQKFVALKKPSIFELLKNILVRVFLGEWSFNEALFYSKSAQVLIESYLGDDIDIVYVDSIRMAIYLSSFNLNKPISVIDYDDIYSLRYENLMECVGGKVDILGFYKQKIPSLVVKLVPFFIKPLLKFESHRVRVRELKYAAIFGRRVIVSPIEADMLSQLTHLDVMDIAMSVPDYSAVWSNSQYQDLRSQSISSHKVTVALVGNFDYFPNQQSVDYIVEQIIPFFEQQSVELTVNLIGRFSPEFKKRYDGTSVNFLGFVDELQAAVANATCLLSPICSGTGIKTKIVESFSLGLPVVTNQKGVEGLDVHHLQEVVLAEMPEDYFKNIMRLSSNHSLSSAVSSNAYNYFYSHFRIDVIREKWLSLIKNVE